MISLHTIEHRSSLDHQLFAMTRLFVNNLFKNNQSSYSSDTTDSIIYFELSLRISKYLRIDVVQKHQYSLSHFQTFNKFHEAFTSWNIKNVKQLQHWVKQDSKVFLEDLNSLWTQRDLDMKACELFDKILSERIWKTYFEKMNKVKKRLNQLNQTFWNQVTELQHQLQSFKEVTSFFFTLFNFFKQFLKLSNSSLFTDEKESIWDDWQEKIRDKLEINIDHFNINKAILIYVHFRIEEDAVKATLAWCQQDSLNLYVIVNDLLNELAQLYDDFDKETNFQREYANLTQEKNKFNEFYSMFQRLFSYLKYHDKQLIIDLRNKIVYRFRAAWNSQLIQSESFNEIRSYLIHLNNEHRVMNDIKEKKFLIKVRKQVIFAEKWDSLNLYRKIEVTTFIDHSKSCDATLTSVKETNLQTESCFICHKSDHFSRECSDRTSRINALEDDEFDRFTSNSESDSDSKN